MVSPMVGCNDWSAVRYSGIQMADGYCASGPRHCVAGRSYCRDGNGLAGPGVVEKDLP